MQKKLTNPFFAAAVREVPRLLGQIDRNPQSPTYGSCDRAFWLYRTNDISSMRYQEAALTLAFLYTTPFEGNVYHHDERVRSWANAAIRFACSRQHANGSFDEWYVNEGSFVCTAFVSAALAEAALVLGDNLEGREALVAALKRSGDWLMRHEEGLVMNQSAGAISALQAIALVTGGSRYETAGNRRCEAFLAAQHGEGWWGEYGGPDAGYLSLTVDYLSRYAARTDDVRVRDAIEKASTFLTHLINPDGTVGGEYLARNTEYLIPSGFVRAASYSQSARKVAAFAVGVAHEGAGIAPHSLDDRYVCYILYNWIEAGIEWEALKEKPTPSTTLLAQPETFFPDAGLFVSGTDAHRMVVNLKKGGSLRLYAHGAVLVDSGVSVRIGKTVCAGNVFSPDTRTDYDPASATLRSAGPLIKVRAPLLTTGQAVLFKGFQLIFGGISVFQRLLKSTLRLVSVTRPGASSDIRYERTVTLKPGKVVITDMVKKVLPREAIMVGGANIYALVPSSRYEASNRLPTLVPESESFEVRDGSVLLTRSFAV